MTYHGVCRFKKPAPAGKLPMKHGKKPGMRWSCQMQNHPPATRQNQMVWVCGSGGLPIPFTQMQEKNILVSLFSPKQKYFCPGQQQVKFNTTPRNSTPCGPTSHKGFPQIGFGYLDGACKFPGDVW